ncbi:hypothetical protein ACROYT_G028468 [Oculina patagonica]
MTRFFPEGQISFTSKYDGQTATGLVGSSVNFTWSFSGDVDNVDWGLKRDGMRDLENGGILVTIKQNGVVSVPAPSAYSGRVSGSGDVSSGQVIFTLSSIRKSDEKYYGCRIDKVTDFDPAKFDSVYLAVRDISKTNRRNICSGCGGERVALNTLATETENQSTNMVPSGDPSNHAFPNSADYMPLHLSGRRWEINREQVKIIKVIGKGAFSQVAKATAWNIRGNEENTTVAVKMLKANAPDSDRKDLLAEVELMKKLKPHPHVIKLMACVTETDPLLVLIEYVPFGDLLGYLRKSRGLNDTYFKDPDVKPQTSLTAEQLMRFAWQVADGMFYLSSRKIIHRDLAARNVLVGEGEKCKVTDFGMARNVHQDDIYTKQSRGRLPVKWTAYEALLYGTYTTQSDVYQIMLKCWEENPNDRPSFAKLKDTMTDMERNHRTYVNLKQYDNSLYANVEDLTAD